MQFVPRRILHALFRPSLWPWCVGFIVGIDLPFPGEKQIRGIWLFLLEVIFPRENNRGRVVDLRSKAKEARFRGRTTADVLSISARRQRKHGSEGEQRAFVVVSARRQRKRGSERKANTVCGIWLFLLEVLGFRGSATGFAVSARRAVPRESELLCSFRSRHFYWLRLVFIFTDLFYHGYTHNSGGGAPQGPPRTFPVPSLSVTSIRIIRYLPNIPKLQ